MTKLTFMRRLSVIPLLLAAMTLVSSRKTSPEDFFARGTESMERGDFAVAARYFSEAYASNPGFVRSGIAAGDAYIAMGQAAFAMRSYSKVLEADPRSIAALTGMGRAHILKKDYGVALKYLKKAAKIEPGSLMNNKAMGAYYESRGSFSIAARYYRRVLRINPADIGSLLGMARIVGSEGEYAAANRYINRARDIQPEHPGIYAVAGELKIREAFRSIGPVQRRNLFSEALESLDSAVRMIPENERLSEEIAYLHIYLGNYKQADHTLENLVRNFPKRAKFLYLLSYLRSLPENPSRNIRSAYSLMQKFLEMRPGDAAGIFSIENMVLNQEKVFLRGNVERRELARKRYARAKGQADSMRFDREQGHISQVLRLNPEHVGALRRRLESYRRNGNYEKFLRVLKRLRDQNPDDFHLNYRLQAALQHRMNSLAYREGLFAIVGKDTRVNFKRTPSHILVFDFSYEGAFPERPDMGRLTAAALNDSIQDRGRIKAISGVERQKILQGLREFEKGKMGNQMGNHIGIQGTYFQARYIARLDGDVRNAKNISIVVGGSYKEIPGGILIRVKVYDRNSGAVLDSFAFSAYGRDALQNVAYQASLRLKERAPLRALAAKIGTKGILLNVGSIDGVKKGMRMRFSGGKRIRASLSLMRSTADAHKSGGTQESRNAQANQASANMLSDESMGRVCRISVVSRYISRCVPVNFSLHEVFKGEKAFLHGSL